MLELTGIRAGYGSEEILHGVSFSVPPATIVAVVGVNGAGKSTTLKVISGLLRPRSGTVTVDGRPLTGGATDGAVRAGGGHVPEGRQGFANMPRRENLLLGAYAVRRVAARGQGPHRARLDEVLAIFPELSSRLGHYAGSLSGGQQQMLAIARGLMSDPRYLLLDEPSLGLAPKIVKEVFAKIKEINKRRKTAVVVVEHNNKSLVEISDRVYVLDKGKVVAEGEPEKMIS